MNQEKVNIFVHFINTYLIVLKNFIQMLDNVLPIWIELINSQRSWTSLPTSSEKTNDERSKIQSIAVFCCNDGVFACVERCVWRAIAARAACGAHGVVRRRRWILGFCWARFVWECVVLRWWKWIDYVLYSIYL